jgi:sugar phosphate isomerase/epimerase
MDHFKNYGDKLIALHLHDNDGTADQHTLNQAGTIDWSWVAKQLKNNSSFISLDYEIIHLTGCKHLSAAEVLSIVKQQADQLEEKIKLS